MRKGGDLPLPDFSVRCWQPQTCHTSPVMTLSVYMSLLVHTSRLVDLTHSLEDTFLMLDALEQDLAFLLKRQPSLALEIGSGSGCAITFLARALYPRALACVATDLNPRATCATLRTAERNLTSVDAVLTCLTDGLPQRRCLFDVVLFNPPYVPTESLCPLAEAPCRQSVASCDPEALLEAAWAGGPKGRYWIDQVMPRIDGLLSPQGVFYMLVLDANMPKQLMDWARDKWKLDSQMVVRRRAGAEALSVLKFWRLETSL